MPCCGDREKIGDIKPEQMWDYIVSDLARSVMNELVADSGTP